MPGLSSRPSQSVPPARNVILLLLSDPESLKKLPASLSPLSKVRGTLGHSCDGTLPSKPTFLRPSSFLNIFTKYLPISNLRGGGELCIPSAPYGCRHLCTRHSVFGQDSEHTPHEAETHSRQRQAMAKLEHLLMPYSLEGFTGGWLGTVSVRLVPLLLLPQHPGRTQKPLPKA